MIDCTTAPDEAYQKLWDVLMDAYNQAAHGKGCIRHTTHPQKFEHQKICEISRRLGSIDGLAFQAIKKTYEACRAYDMHQEERAVADLLGAINYIAAMVILIQEWASEDTPGGKG